MGEYEPRIQPGNRAADTAADTATDTATDTAAESNRKCGSRGKSSRGSNSPWRPTALVKKFRKPDRVGRRGLSEPREDFPRLPTDAFPWLYS